MFAQLLDDIYATALDPRRWEPALSSVTAFCGGHAANVYAPRLAGVSLSALDGYVRYNPSDDYTADDYRHYAAFDRFSDRMMAAIGHDTTRAISVMATAPDPADLRSEYYQDFMRGLNAGDNLSVFLRPPSPGRPTPILGVTTPWGADPFSRDQIRRLALLAPHLQRATRILTEIAPAAPLDPAFADAMERLPTSALLIGQGGRVILANDSARRRLRRTRSVAVKSGRLRAADAASDRRLAALVDLAISADPGGPRAGGETDVAGPDGERLVAIVTPLGGDNPFRDRLGPCRAAVFLLASDGAGDGGAEDGGADDGGADDGGAGGARLERLFGLTPA